MPRRETVFILTAAVLAATLGGYLQLRSRQAHQPAGVEVRLGQAAPALQLPDLAGKPHDLASYRGHRVLLNFWASWCLPCLKELPALDTAQDKFGQNGTIVLGIAMDDPARVRAFLADHPQHYPILLGSLAPPSTSLRFGDIDEVLPYSVLVGADGRVMATRRGPLSHAMLAQWLQAPTAATPHTSAHGE